MFGREKKDKKVSEVENYGLVLDEEFEDDEDESLSVYDAADIYFSNGQDEDYMFGYTHEELVRAHKNQLQITQLQEGPRFHADLGLFFLPIMYFKNER